jgi:uncharacterized delta-60 repeat protein
MTVKPIFPRSLEADPSGEIERLKKFSAIQQILPETQSMTTIMNYYKPYLFKFALTLWLSIAVSSSASPAYAAAGDIDRSFGNNGFVKTAFPIIASEMGDSIFQPDGKLIIVGAAFQSGSDIDFYVLRFNPNGTLDNSFGTGGRMLIAVSTREDRANGIGLQPDGKIIVIGTSRSAAATYDFAVVRLNEDGTPDTTFGTGGIVIAPTSTGDDFAKDVVVQSDNKIVVAGQGVGPNGMSFTVIRLLQNGSFDNSFDGDGITRTAFPTGLSEALVVKLQPDGKIVAAGAAAFGDFTNTAFGFARYLPDGTPDTSFGTNGTVVLEVRTGAARQNVANDLLIQPDGKIVAVGYTNSGLATSIDFAVARLNSDGSPDNSFGSEGKIVTPISNRDDFARAVALQADGKLVVGGSSSIANDPDFTIVRYNPNGTLDTQFGNNGIAATRLPNSGESVLSLRIGTDGRFYVSGHSRFEAFFAIFLVNGSREMDFDGDKKSDISIFRPSAGEWWINRSSTLETVGAQFGNSADKPTPADFTGDGKTDIAFWRPSTGEWFILRSEDASFLSFPFGANGDVPAVGDFDGDGKADAVIFRPSTNEWFISKSTGGTIITIFGASGDVPVAADYDGDGKTDIAIFRPSDGSWWYVRSTDNQFRVFSFGVSTDKPVQGDWTGDGKADIAVFRPSTGEWFFQRSEDNSFYSVPFGALGDVPAPADYDGDGRFDTAVFRPSNSNWFVQRSSAGILIAGFGAAGDRPLPNVFVP